MIGSGTEDRTAAASFRQSFDAFSLAALDPGFGPGLRLLLQSICRCCWSCVYLPEALRVIYRPTG